MASITIEKMVNFAYGFRFDPEFYQPTFMRCRQRLSNGQTLEKLLDDIRYGVQAEPVYIKNGVNYIRALNLSESWIDGEILKINQEQVPSDKYLLKHGDILITRSGANCGDVGIITGKLCDSTFGSYTIRLRFKKGINPFAVFAFLLSDCGKLQTLQIRYGSAQPNLSIPYLKNLITIPEFDEKLGNKLEGLILDTVRLAHSQRSLYEEAETELLERIGWQDLSKKPCDLWYIEDSKNFGERGRMDAEHYQPRYNRLKRKLEKLGAICINKFCQYPIKGITPEYNESGECYAVNSQHLGPSGIDYEGLQRINKAFYESDIAKPARVFHEDVLTYATGAYIGRTNVWLFDKPTIAGIDCLITRPNRDVCIPAYLALFLNSPAGQSQAIQFASGSAQRHIYPRDLAKFFVYIPRNVNGKVDMAWQEKLAEKVLAAAQAKVKARVKLEEAKQFVESALKQN